MRVLGTIDFCVNLLDNTFTIDELKDLNLYKMCEDDLKYRLEVWDNDVLFDDYYDMYEYIIQMENLSEEDETKAYDITDELCEYIKKRWEDKLPEITDVEFSQPDVEGWVDTVYEVKCNYKKMYLEMKGE